MNTIEYCKWRGDISFNKDSFNNVDGIMFAQLAYCDFDNLFKENERKTIYQLYKELYEDENKQKICNSGSFLADSSILLKNIANTNRFGSLKVRNYISINSSEEVEQFGVLMIDLPKGLTVVAFRGTDDSLVGWKENFQLSYCTTKSQHEAVNYVNKYCKPFRRYIFLGHSKGGNLALYAATKCKRMVQNRIIKVISYDGPGLYDVSYEQALYNRIKSRYVKIVPEYDVVGMLFDKSENKIIVKSDAEKIKQHSSPTWEVEGNHFVQAEQLCNESIKFKKAFDVFIEETSAEERKEFVEELFLKIDELGFVNIYDFSSLSIGKIISIIRSVGSISKDTLNTANLFLKCFAVALGYDFIDEIENRVISFIEDISNSIIK